MLDLRFRMIRETLKDIGSYLGEKDCVYYDDTNHRYHIAACILLRIPDSYDENEDMIDFKLIDDDAHIYMLKSHYLQHFSPLIKYSN